MSIWLWARSSSLHYQRRHRVGDRVFLALAKRKIARLSGRRPYYLALVPPSHQGLMRLSDGRSYRWFPVLKNGYSSVVRMLVSLYGVGERYSNFVAPLPSERHGKHNVTRLKIRMFGRTEFVCWPRPIMASFLQEQAFCADRHLWPQHFFLGQDATYFTHIFSFLDLPRVAEFLSDLHKTQVKLPQVNSSGGLPMPHLSASLRRRVEVLYKDDMEIFGRHMPPPQV